MTATQIPLFFPPRTSLVGATATATAAPGASSSGERKSKFFMFTNLPTNQQNTHYVRSFAGISVTPTTFDINILLKYQRVSGGIIIIDTSTFV